MGELAAIVLCGGESRRMGRPKAWLDFGEEKLLSRVVRLVGTVADPVVVVAAPGQDLPVLPEGTTVARDALPGRGPLEGLLAGLWALPPETQFAYATATDAPFLNPSWITLLRQTIGSDDMALPYVGGRHHPLAALYRVRSVRPAVERLLRADRCRLLDLMEAVRTRVVRQEELEAVDRGCPTLRNLNSPEEYQQAIRDARL
ncbi:MAG TPA: molybdenum cofactor guanylyltransferase [Pirellulales bacterium]|nr:molybdenum cofactor guanylyltransferase [Pirellulales bacterium]